MKQNKSVEWGSISEIVFLAALPAESTTPLQYSHGAPANLPQFCNLTISHNVPLQLQGLCTYVTLAQISWALAAGLAVVEGRVRCD